MPRIPKFEYHKARERKERELADRTDDKIARMLHRELAERHRREAARADADNPDLSLVARR